MDLIKLGFSSDLQNAAYRNFMQDAVTFATLDTMLAKLQAKEDLYGVSNNVGELIYFLAYLYYKVIFPTLASNFNTTSDWLTTEEIETIEYYATLYNLKS